MVPSFVDAGMSYGATLQIKMSLIDEDVLAGLSNFQLLEPFSFILRRKCGSLVRSCGT